MVTLHRLGKLYGKLPSEILALSPLEFSLNRRIAEVGSAQDRKDAEGK